MMATRNKKEGRLNPKYADQVDPDPLNAVPMVAEGVESRGDPKLGLQLRLQAPPRSKMEHFFAKTLSLQRTTRVNLDAQGSFFWGLIDGRRNLHEIAREIEKELSVTSKEAQEAAIVFTRDLMLRGLIQLRVNRRSAANTG